MNNQISLVFLFFSLADFFWSWCSLFLYILLFAAIEMSKNSTASEIPSKIFNFGFKEMKNRK